MNHINLSQRLFLIIMLICGICILLRSCVVSCEPPKAGTVHLLRPHPYSMGKRRRDWEVAELLNTHGETVTSLAYFIPCRRKYSQWEYRKANIHSVYLHPTFLPCAACMSHWSCWPLYFLWQLVYSEDTQTMNTWYLFVLFLVTIECGFVLLTRVCSVFTLQNCEHYTL